MAKGWLRQSWRRLKSAEDAFKEKDYPYVVRQCQECVELALKALLMDVGVDVPKWHDVGPVLRRNAEKLSFLDKRTIQRLASHSRELRSDRERSMYGDEELELPPEEIYEQYDAEVGLERAREVYEVCRNVLERAKETEDAGK